MSYPLSLRFPSIWRPQYWTTIQHLLRIAGLSTTKVLSMTKTVILERWWDVLSYPAYSPDLAPTDYHFFWSCQHNFARKSFRTEAQVKSCKLHWCFYCIQTYTSFSKMGYTSEQYLKQWPTSDHSHANSFYWLQSSGCV